MNQVSMQERITSTPQNFFGEPIATFVMDSGELIEVTHEGDHISVRNTGRKMTEGLAVIPISGNMVDIRVT